jgi:hypothetical protein
MKRLACVIAAVLLMVSLAGAATNLNSSKSNYYRMTYSTAVVTPAQAAAILADLDKTPGMDEAKIKRVLTQQGFARHGVDPARVKKILIRPDKERKSISIIILDKPADEAAAIAADDESARKVISEGKGKMPPYGRAAQPTPSPRPR